MNANLLIAVKSCQAHRDEGYHDVIRNTWGKDVSAGSLGFFMGGEPFTAEEHGDEVYLEVEDDYRFLPWKTRAIIQWAMTRDYDYVFPCDTDTFIIPNNLVNSGFQYWDYFGINSKPLGKTFPYVAVDRDGKSHFIQDCYPWMSGGFGYFLSRRAMQALQFAEINTWAEDLWVGQVLGPLHASGGIVASNMARGISTWHAPPGSNAARCKHWMESMYRTHQ